MNTNRKPVSWVAGFFFGSPLLFLLPAVLMPVGVPAYAALALGAAAAIAAGKALLSRI